MPLPSTGAQRSLSLVVRFDQYLFSWSGSTSVVTMMMIISACISDTILPRNMLDTFYSLGPNVVALVESNQTNQTHNNTALPNLPSRRPSLFRRKPLASTLDSPTSLLLPRSMLTNFYLDRCSRWCCSTRIRSSVHDCSIRRKGDWES